MGKLYHNSLFFLDLGAFLSRSNLLKWHIHIDKVHIILHSTAEAPNPCPPNIMGYGGDCRNSSEVLRLPSPNLTAHLVPRFLFIAHLFLSNNFGCHHYKWEPRLCFYGMPQTQKPRVSEAHTWAQTCQSHLMPRNDTGNHFIPSNLFLWVNIHMSDQKMGPIHMGSYWTESIMNLLFLSTRSWGCLSPFTILPFSIV